MSRRCSRLRQSPSSRGRESPTTGAPWYREGLRPVRPPAAGLPSPGGTGTTPTTGGGLIHRTPEPVVYDLSLYCIQ